MTEAEWLSGVYPQSMLSQIVARAGPRKLRLLLAGLIGRISANYDVPVRPEATLEQLADGSIGRRELAARRATFRSAQVRFSLMPVGEDASYLTFTFRRLCGMGLARSPADTAQYVLDGLDSLEASWLIVRSPGLPVGDYDGIRVAVRKAMAGVIRDIFGNPFRPVAFDPRWRTADAIDLARGIYEDRAFERMPLLADTLMDAACADEQVLGHCQSEGPHVRGCWVVDLILGKQ